MGRRPYRIVIMSEVLTHLAHIERKYWPLIRAVINEQLAHDPETQTRNRKPLTEQVRGAEWELRFGPDNRFRVFYDVDLAVHEVRVMAVGVKRRGTLVIAGEEFRP